MLEQKKASLPHGQWLPWLNGEIDSGRLKVKIRQTQKYMQLASNTHRSAYLEESPSIRAALELLSDKEPTEQQGTLIDVDAERKAREEAERQVEAEKRRTQEFREESNERRKKIRELEQQLELAERAEPKVVEKIIEKPMIPQEFSSLEDAIAAKRKDLENLDRNTQDAIQKNRAVYESRERLQREVEELTTLLSKHKASEREQVEHKRLTDSALQFTALFLAEIQALEYAPNAEQYRRWKQVSAQFRDSILVVEETINRLSDNPVSGELMDRVQ
jgi:chromosome segregation ATPase